MFKISWPEQLTKIITSLMGSSLDDLNFSKLSASVLRVSDLFLEGAGTKESKTPWADTELRRAYLSYFFPLNTLRVMRVLDEAKNRGFLEGIDHVIDVGSGPGTVELAFSLSGLLGPGGAADNRTLRFENYEPFPEAHKVHAAWNPQVEFVDQLKPSSKDNKTLYVLSYSLNEMTEWPRALDSAEAVMIIEPSMRDHGRRLMEVRQQLIDKGFSLWAPCTHQLACPLLTKTKTDWCHHRFAIAPAPWFEKLEEHLPMKNNTLTLSYLLARKAQKVPATVSANTTRSRVIGDTLFEKGKTRQMICRRDEREFLSFLTRQGDWEGLPNGSIVELPTNLTQKAAEVRLDKADLDKLAPTP